MVSIGGGHGLASTLEALRLLGHFPLGVVSVADDGGSSGRLRRAFGQIPPGDLRRCLSALIPSDSPWSTLLEFRFRESELKGHALGNLIFTALNSIHDDPVMAAIALAELVGAAGCVLPASLDPLTLVGRKDGGEISGQAQVTKTAGISEMRLMPEDPRVPSAVLEAINSATTITLGPGSLYTSILAVCAIPAIKTALGASVARTILVANLASDGLEAQGMAISDHVEILQKAGICVDVVLYDDMMISAGNFAVASTQTTWVRSELAGHDPRMHDTTHLAKALVPLVI